MKDTAAQMMQSAQRAAEKRHAAWVSSMMEKIPAPLRGTTGKDFNHVYQHKGMWAANTFLRKACESKAIQDVQANFGLHDESEVRELAQIHAHNTERRISRKLRNEARKEYAAASAEGAAEDAKASIENAIKDVPPEFQALAAIVAAGRAVLEKGVKPATTAKTITGFVERAKDVRWWRRNMRRQSNQSIDQAARQLGRVRRRVEPYCADTTVSRRAVQNQRNQEAMEAVTMESDDGYQATLAELAQKSTANPELRRVELMVRCRGLEDWAKTVGYVSEFWTITTSSKYHRYRGNGRLNRGWNESTPAQAMSYLNGVWSRIRAEFHRAGIPAIGLRVVEPHHDGTPHWHLLCHLPESLREQARDIVRKYALAEDANESGAKKYRFDAVAVDPSKGSATGYIAKYISKNINGHGVQYDDESQDFASNSSQRIQAWAACWRIRQFQFFGLSRAPVGLWRALRRIEQPIQTSDLIEKLRLAADIGDYGSYMTQCAVSLAHLFSESTEKLNTYGEPVAPIAIGVASAMTGDFVPLIKRQWRVVEGLKKGAKAPPWSSGNNCTEMSCHVDAKHTSGSNRTKNHQIKGRATDDANDSGGRNKNNLGRHDKTTKADGHLH